MSALAGIPDFVLRERADKGCAESKAELCLRGLASYPLQRQQNAVMRAAFKAKRVA